MDHIHKQHPSAKIALNRSGGGAFEITVAGRLVYSKLATGRFPTEAEIAAVIDAPLDGNGN